MLTKVPEHIRGWMYAGFALVLFTSLIVMGVVDVLRGGDVWDWVPYVLGIMGWGGTYMASKNTSRERPDS